MKVTITILICGLISVAFSTGHVKIRHTHQRRHSIAYRNIIPEGLELFLNGTSGQIGLLNTTTNVGAIVDISSSSVALFNGQGGNAIAISSQTICKIDNAWTLSSVHFDEYFRSLPGLQNLLQSGKVVNLQEVEPELTRLATQLGVESNAFENLAGAAKVLNQNQAILRLLIGLDHFRVRGTFVRTVTVLKGLADLFTAKPQDLEQLTKSRNRLDLPSIFNAPNGLQAFLRVLQSLGPINLAPLVGNPLSRLDNCLKIIVELGGNDPDDGIDNVLRIVYNIVALIDGQGSLDALIQALIEAGQNAGVEINASDITPVIDDLLKLAENQNALFQTGGIFNVIIRFLRDLNSNNLFMNDINISRLLLLLRKGDYKGAIDMIVRFFLRFNNLLNPAMSIPRFFGYLLTFFNSTRGARFLPQFLPGVDPSQARQQLQGVNVINIFQNRSDVSNLTNIPVIGQLFNVFNSSVGGGSNGTLSFQGLLRRSGGAGIFPPAEFGRFFGLGFLEPLQNFFNNNPFQNFFQNLPGGGGGGNSPSGSIGVPNITNILVNNSVPCSNESTTTTEPVPVSNILFVDLTTSEGPEEGRLKRRNHHGHARKGTKHEHEHEKHHKSHLKHHKHERKHGEKNHEHS